jgi:LemA protein
LSVGSIVIIGLVVVVAGGVVALYNHLVTLRNRCDNSWAQIDVQLRRRHDLIPNLVETVKGYAAHERGTFESVVRARDTAMSAQNVADRSAAESALSSTLRSLFAVAEAYPELKADSSFLDLQAQLTDTEGKIAYARQFFNDCVMSYNMAVQRFPANLLAGAFGFRAKTYFEIEASAKEPVNVQL